jgi:thioredoxin reductase (NADPH)
MERMYDVIIVGSGPAGLTAGLYTSRARLRTLILEKEIIGGELMNRDLIENYPGYPDGILGPELGSNMIKQVMDYSPEIKLAEVEQVEINDDCKLLKTSQGNYWGKAIIIAGGSHSRKLGVVGEQEYINKGVFYCATCDGHHFTDKIVAVAGGGDSGITEALLLTRLVSKVVVIELLPNLTATRILQERAYSNPKIEINCGIKIEAIRGDEKVEALEILDFQTQKRGVLEIDGLLVHVGIEPNTEYLKTKVPLDERGQIIVNGKMETEIAGIYAAGDIRHNSPWQISTAVGDGATAALSLEKYLISIT